VLAVVEDQQDRLVAQVGDEVRRRVVGLDRQAEDRGQRGRGESRIGERAEIDEENLAREGLDQVVGDGDGDRGLADATGAGDRDEALRREVHRERPRPFDAPDHAQQPAGQEGAAGQHARPGRGRVVAMQRRLRDEAVAPPGQGRDVARPVLSVAERLAQRGDVEAQAALLDDDVRPDLGDELALAHHLVRSGGQRDQGVERASAQLDRLVAAQQHPLGGKQPERAEENLATAVYSLRRHRFS
jgi:hypothetical protein